MESFDKQLKEFVTEVCKETIENGTQEISFQDITFQDFLKQQRINKSTFGNIIGVTGSTITKYYQEPGLLKVSQVNNLAKETGVDVRELINIINYKKRWAY